MFKMQLQIAPELRMQPVWPRLFATHNVTVNLWLLILTLGSFLLCLTLQTDWEGGYYPLTLIFTEDYPSKPPKCTFPTDFFHLNVYQSGLVCLSILSESSGWRPAITVKQILCGIQDLLDTPNPASAAQPNANALFTRHRAEYKKRVQEQAKRYPSKL